MFYWQISYKNVANILYRFSNISYFVKARGKRAKSLLMQINKHVFQIYQIGTLNIKVKTTIEILI